MEEEKKKAYSEVVEILKLIEDEKKIEAIPFEVIQLIKTNSDSAYKPNISKEIPLEGQNLRDETYSILGWIASKYWGEEITTNKTENIEIKEEISDSDREFEYIKRLNNSTEEYDVKSIDTSKITNASVYNDIQPECLEGSNLPVLVSNMNWYERIKTKIVKILKILFRMGNKEKEGVNE